ncbi:MAG: ParB/RepB/Spo0J family partition protein [Microbacterium sp.]|uniref:ParB/RepB/Spo0J family partition protein n=1 Tax=Microbacterium sp. TaxID=51671 RepID=UPI003F98A343
MSETSTAGTVEQVDPKVIILERNIRTDAPIDKGFIESIRTNGVIQPVVGWRDQDGAVHVRYGQRRTLGAREAGVATIPVYIVPVDTADESDEARRLVEQLVENEQRAEITDADRTAAWKALELEGISVTAIAKRTGAKRDRVKTGLAVASSDTGTRLISEAGLTLDQAAMLLEFEDDPELIANLTDAAIENPGYFPHVIERARQERQRQEAQEAIEAIEATRGHRILSEYPEHGQAPWPIHGLRTADGEQVDVESIQGKAGVAVLVQTWSYQTEPRVTHYVDDPESLGLTVTEYAQQSGPTSGPMTDEQKAERKILIANNKEWDAAEVVRREWLTTLFGRKTLPKNAPAVVASLLTSARHQVSDAMGRGNGLAAQLLNIERETGYYSDAFADYLTAHPAKAAHVSLAIVIGGLDSSTSRDTWRNPHKEAARYFQIIADWGYTLSPVEEIAAMIENSTTE